MKLEIESIKGIGPKLAEKLIDRGIDSIEKLSSLTPREFANISGKSVKFSMDVIREGQNRMLDILEGHLKSGQEVLDYRQKIMKHIPTGSSDLDRILGGGWCTTAVTMLTGKYSTGKTQLAHQAVVNCKKYLDRKSIYLSTEPQSFIPERMVEMADAMAIEFDLSKDVYGITADMILTPEHLLNCYKLIPRKIEQGMDVGLVVVDCLDPDTEILTPKGLTKIKDLQSNITTIIGDRSKRMSLVPTEVSNKIKIYHPKMLKISTPYRDIICSKNHRFLRKGTNNIYGYKPEKIYAKNIKNGTSLIVSKYLKYDGEEWIGEKASELFGFTLGNGNIENRYIGLDNKNKELLEYYKKIARDLQLSTGEIFSYIGTKTGETYYRLILTKGENEELFKAFRSKDYTKIKTTTENESKAFIRGFFDAEGNAFISEKIYKGEFGESKKISLTISNKDLELLKTIKILLHRFGILALKPSRDEDEVYNIVVVRKDSIKNFIEKIGSKHSEKIVVLNNLKEYLVNSKGTTWSKDSLVTIEHVNKIQEIEGREAMELSVPLTERYIANGFLVHNSFSAKFRELSGGREDLPDRSRSQYKHFGYLQHLASKYNLAVLITVQIMGVPDTGQQLGVQAKTGIREQFWGGSAVGHSPSFSLALALISIKRKEWKGILFDGPLPRDEALFMINTMGIRDIKRTKGKL